MMETKNTIINNYTMSLMTMVNSFNGTETMLNDNADENASTIKTLNVILESIRSQVVLIQGALDSYGG